MNKKILIGITIFVLLAGTVLANIQTETTGQWIDVPNLQQNIWIGTTQPNPNGTIINAYTTNDYCKTKEGNN
jgi:hypothetical protein